LIGKFINKLIGRKSDSAPVPVDNNQQRKTPAPGRNDRNRSQRSNKRTDNRTDNRSESHGEKRSDTRVDSRNEHRVEKNPAATQDHKKPRSNHSKPRPSKPVAVSVEPWDISMFPVTPEEGKTRFHDFDLESPLMHAIADLGFSFCSPIQAQSLPYALKGRDVVGKAQTGTGKTAAFLAAIIDDLLKNPIAEKRYAGEARALVIAPTRELVIQIAEDAKLLCKYTDLKIHTLVGGMDYVKQQRHLHNDLVDILVATPGRLLDFCGNKDVYLDQLEVLVIDEADRMLDMGFIPQVRQIVRQAPRREDRQTLFFSATFTDEVRTLVEQWTYEPVTVDIQPESVATDSVTQHVYLSSTEEKYTLLYNLIQQENAESMIVFANRRDECRDLQEKLERHGIKAGLLSGEIAQNKRVSTLDAFKDGTIKVLVATDVAGRGIHISGISHVVNFTLPEEPEDYVHRIGRTGRAGKLGTSISFACEDDAFRLEPLQTLLGKEIKCEQPPEHLLLPPPELPPAPRRPRDDQARSRSRSGNGGSRNAGASRRPPSRR
jgi:ATP-dependent RNA helicase RhlB